MAVNLTDMDIGTRYALQEDFNNGFVGRDRQVVIQTDDPKGYRPVIMDGATTGGKNKVALVDDLSDYVPVDTYNSEKAGFATKTELSGYETTTHASATYATKTELTSGLAGKANSVHTHEIANVNGLQTALDSKQAAGNYAQATHSHTKSQITDFTHTHTTSEITNLDSTLAAKADSSALTNLVPKTGSRGALAGYETPLVQATDLTINGDSRDSNLVTGAFAIMVSNGAASQSWTKTVALSSASATITLGSSWKWVGGTAPPVSANCVVVLHWCNSFGIAKLVATS